MPRKPTFDSLKKMVEKKLKELEVARQRVATIEGELAEIRNSIAPSQTMPVFTHAEPMPEESGAPGETAINDNMGAGRWI